MVPLHQAASFDSAALRPAQDEEIGGTEFNCCIVVSSSAQQYRRPMNGCWLYILRCSDGSYYVGTTRHEDPQTRVSEHNLGESETAYTIYRRPVTLVFAEWFDLITEAIAMERQVKGWTRAKKEALIAREWERLPDLARGPRAKPMTNATEGVSGALVRPSTRGPGGRGSG